jgi:hypothetical protein
VNKSAPGGGPSAEQKGGVASIGIITSTDKDGEKQSFRTAASCVVGGVFLSALDVAFALLGRSPMQ